VKILIYSPHFHPCVGGLENVVSGLARGFHEEQHQVTVICNTAGKDPGPEPFPFRVVRHPTSWQLLQHVRDSDLVLHACVNIRGLWPLLVTRKPLAITHQVYLTHPVPHPTRFSKVVREIKRLSTRRAFLNIACSQCLAGHIGRSCVAVPNFYDEDTFRLMEDVERDGDLVFLGRLVSDKGADLAIEALRILHAEHQIRPWLTIIGDGPERGRLETQAAGAQVAPFVRFAGVLQGQDLARELNRHRILVVPSRWPEPFGIVALEGIACGLAVVGSDRGGLPEAIGPCGIAVANEDAPAIARAAATLLQEPQTLAKACAQAPQHLQVHTRQHATAQYLRLIFDRLRRPLH